MSLMRLAATSSCLAVTLARPLLILAAFVVAIPPARLAAQEDPGRSAADTATAKDSMYTSSIGGEFRPAKGFDLVRTKRSSLNISFYGLFRYMNQTPGGKMGAYDAASTEVRNKFWGLLLDGMKLWPMFSLVSFLWIPVEKRIVAGCAVGVLWWIYLSLMVGS